MSGGKIHWNVYFRLENKGSDYTNNTKYIITLYSI